MLIDRIYRKVKTYLNTEGRGNIKPERFNVLAHDQIQERQLELIDEINKFINRENRGLGGSHIENLPQVTREKLQFYLEEEQLSNDANETLIYTIPDNSNFIDELEGVDVDASLEVCKTKKNFNILKTQATASYPLYYIRGRKIITSHPLGDLDVSYLRTPKKPKWTYTLFQNNELFNPNQPDFQDADIHPSEEDVIVRKILIACGITLKDKSVVEFGTREERNKFNQKNTN